MKDSQAVIEAKKFPKGWDWFWLVWFVGWAVFAASIGLWAFTIIHILFGASFLYIRRLDRISDARFKDRMKELDADLARAWKEFQESIEEHERGLKK